jgi:hypothetical protein
MQRYRFKPEATTEDMRLSVALLIEEDPAGEWAKHEDAARIIDDLIRQNVALDGELEQALRERDGYRKALEAATQTIAQKQGRIEEIEARPAAHPEQDAFIDGTLRFFEMIDWLMGDYREAVTRVDSVASSAAREMVALYDRLVKAGAALRPREEEVA